MRRCLKVPYSHPSRGRAVLLALWTFTSVNRIRLRRRLRNFLPAFALTGCSNNLG